jgi:hypothetical protein
VEFVEFVIQILKKVAKLATEAEARPFHCPGTPGGAGGGVPRGTDRFPTRFRVSPL